MALTLSDTTKSKGSHFILHLILSLWSPKHFFCYNKCPQNTDKWTTEKSKLIIKWLWFWGQRKLIAALLISHVHVSYFHIAYCHLVTIINILFVITMAGMDVDREGLIGVYTHIYNCIGIACQLPSSADHLERHVIAASLPFLRCAALLFHSLTDVPEPAQLHGML